MAQGGGPTAVINQSLAGVVLEARKFPEIERVYGARFGVSGIVKEDFVDLSSVDASHLELVAKTPGSALGSTRDKPNKAYCERMFAVMQKHNIRYFFTSVAMIVPRPVVSSMTKPRRSAMNCA